LRAGLRDLGYVEGQNIFIGFRWAEGNYSRLVEFAPITTPKSNHITDFMTVPETCRSGAAAHEGLSLPKGAGNNALDQARASWGVVR
jgi:hypothetical protein